jgi:hypothetical protein
MKWTGAGATGIWVNALGGTGLVTATLVPCTWASDIAGDLPLISGLTPDGN